MADPLSIAVSSIALIESCMRLGKFMHQKYDAYKGADLEVAEILLKLKVTWDTAEAQMELIKNIWATLGPIRQQNQHMLIAMLETKLQQATHVLDTIIAGEGDVSSFSDVLNKTGSLSKARYAFNAKKHLDKAVLEFLDWYTVFDRSWWFIAGTTNENLESYLKINQSTGTAPVKALFSLRKSIQTLKARASQSSKEISFGDFLEVRTPIHRSTAALAQFKDNNSYAVVDSITVNEFTDSGVITQDVKALVTAMSRMDPLLFGLLRCCGVINKSRMGDEKTSLVFDLAFEIPKDFSSPESLRNMLGDQQSRPALDFRLTMAKQLASSILCLHTLGFVHKNVRPENILLLSPKDGTSKKAFLVGFESFRMVQTDTFFIGDQLVERDLYRHPFRQGPKPQDAYVLQHDMYSLGVCLLEIGLWVLFVKQTQSEGGFIPAPELCLDEALKNMDQLDRALAIKKQLLKLAEDQLPGHMGPKFSEIVIDCLTCLDPSRSGMLPQSGSSDTDAGVEFIENVLTKLIEIVV